MGWTAGHLEGRFTARAAIEFEFDAEFAARVVDAVRYGQVIYAAIRSSDGKEVFGLVLLAERRNGVLFTKPINEDMGPVEDHCPARILDQLTEPSNNNAREWRKRCRARLARPHPRLGQKVIFVKPLRFTNGDVHGALTFQGGSRFRSADGTLYHIRSWRELDYSVEA
ncbi:MAG: DUF6927 domain-containing protein [Solirubrobacterales bacterium]